MRGDFGMTLNRILSRGKSGLVSSLLLLAAMWLTGCHQPDPPEYYGYQNLQFVKGEGSTAKVSALVKMYNPNPYNLKLKRAELEVKVNGKHAGHSLLDSTIFIPGKDTFYVPVSVDVDLKAVLSNALQLLVDPKANVSLDGRVKVQKGILTFNRGFHYDGKQDIRALLDGGGL